MSYSRKKEKLLTPNSVKTIAMVFIGFICTIISATGDLRQGLSFVFILPLSFAVSRFLFQRAYSYCFDNVALTIIFVSIYARYLATPVLMAISNSCLTTVTPSKGNYYLALIVQVFELFTTLTAIDVLWTKHKKTQHAINLNQLSEPANFRLSLTGVIFIIALIMLVVSRGHLANVFSHFSTWWYVSEETSDLFTYDLMAVDIVKSTIMITLVAMLARKYRKLKSRASRNGVFFVALLVGIAATMFYEYTARTSLAQLILSIMIVLISFFPEKRKSLLLFFGVGGTAFVFYIFASGTMAYQMGNTSDNVLETMTKMGELYVSGPSMVAITQDKYDWVRANMSIATYASDLINTTHIFGLFPVLRNINNLVAGIPTTNILFVKSLGGLTYILPNYSLWTYYATSVLGWLGEALSIFVVVKLACIVDEKKNIINDGCYYYAMAYVEILLGQAIFVNNTFLLWHAFTNLPFWLLLFSFVNRAGNKVRIK